MFGSLPNTGANFTDLGGERALQASSLRSQKHETACVTARCGYIRECICSITTTANFIAKTLISRVLRKNLERPFMFIAPELFSITTTGSMQRSFLLII